MKVIAEPADLIDPYPTMAELYQRVLDKIVMEYLETQMKGLFIEGGGVCPPKK